MVAARTLLPRRRFTGSDIERMVRIGVLSEDDHLELLEGTLYFKGTDSIPGFPWGQPRRFSIDEVERLVEEGVLGVRDRIGLIADGLVTPPPQNPPHGVLLEELRDRLIAAYRDLDVHLIEQRPLHVGAARQPEPDLAVIRGAQRDYIAEHPRGRDALLVVEVSSSSLAHDRAKAALYAGGGVPVYWILDLDGRRLEIYSQPVRKRSRYRKKTVFFAKEIAPVPGLTVGFLVRSMLP